MCSHTKQRRARRSSLNVGKPDGPVWQTGLSGFVGTDDSQGRHRASTREPLLQPSDVWSVKELEPWQFKGLRRQLRDLIDKKKGKLKNYDKTYEK
jgi:hypothetical protein